MAAVYITGSLHFSSVMYIPIPGLLLLQQMLASLPLQHFIAGSKDRDRPPSLLTSFQSLTIISHVSTFSCISSTVLGTSISGRCFRYDSLRSMGFFHINHHLQLTFYVLSSCLRCVVTLGMLLHGASHRLYIVQ